LLESIGAANHAAAVGCDNDSNVLSIYHSLGYVRPVSSRAPDPSRRALEIGFN